MSTLNNAVTNHLEANKKQQDEPNRKYSQEFWRKVMIDETQLMSDRLKASELLARICGDI